MMTSLLCSLRTASRNYFRPLFATLLAAIASLPAQSQTSTGAQQLVFAGLHSVNQQGQFNAIKTDASGNLFLLLDQKDGVRILKTNPTATTLLAQSLLGAAGDIGLSLALDPSGNVYVAGTTTSTTLTGTSGAAFPTRADTSTNSFIAKYDTNLNSLFVTFAGSGRLAATSVAATSDAVFLTGSLFAATLPVTPNAFQQTPAQGSSQDGFVERFSANGSTLVYATYLTGAGGDTSPAALTADSTDSAYIAGYTTASGFPTVAALAPIIQAAAANSTPSSGFLTKLTPAGDAITFSTYIPGSGISSLVIDAAQNNLLLSGTIDFSAFPVANVQTPLVATPYQSLLRIALNGSSVLGSTLLAPGTQSFVTPSTNGTVWADGTLTTPLLPLTSLAGTGASYAARVTAQGAVDQTARFGGLASINAANASAPVTLTSLATDLTGQPFLAGAFTPTASSSLLGTETYDLPLANASTAILPSTVQSAALPANACSGSLCSGSAAYLAKLTTASNTAFLAFSIGSSPDIILRNLSTTQATNLQLSATAFTLANTCPTTLPAGAECDIALTGSGPGTLTVTADNATTQTVSLPATTTTATPIVFFPRELDFGVETLSSAPILRTITITNLSQATQTFTSAADILVTKNTPASPFTESSSDCTATSTATTKTLAAGATCHITLAFAINSTINDGPVTALWKIAASGSHDVTLTAYANAASLNTSTTHIDFGTQYTGGLRSPRYLYLSNNSDTSISHTPISVSSPFTATDRCPATLPAHSVCQIQFAYESPTSPSNDATTIALDQGLSVLVSGNTLPNPNGGSSTVNPSLTVTPTSVTFSNSIPVTTQSTTQTVTITNTGATSFLLTLSLTGDFTQATSCTSSLPANASCSAVLTFAPTAPGTRTGLFSVTAGSSTPLYVNLTGTATAILPQNNGALTFAPAALVQPSAQWLKISQPFQSLTATTTGPFTVILVEDIGYGHGTPAPSAFHTTTTGTCLNCYLGVQFTPTATGPQTGTLSLTSGTNTNAYTLALSGSGLPTTGLIVTPVTQDFGSVPVNSASQPYLFSLTNLLTTNTTITLTAPTVTGDFAISQAPTGGSSCTGTLAPAATCFVQVAFNPTATGTRTGALTFPTSSGNAIATLTGTATADPGLALSPNALTFQNVPGTTSTQQTITLTNTGSTTYQISTPTATATTFTATTTCSTLTPTAACTVTITYIPTSAQLTATLQIPVTTTSGGVQTTTTYTVPLTGAYTSVNAGLQILPAQVNFGPTTVDTVGLTRTFTLNNLTAQPLTPTLNITHQFALTTPNPCPTLAANASCNFNITTLPLITSDNIGTIYAQAAAYTSLTYLETFGTNTASSALRITGPLSPGTGILDFGQVTSGQSLAQTLTLTNISTSQQTITLRRITSQPPFLSTSTCGATLSPTQSCTVTVTYAPINQVAISSPATQNTGTLTLESDDSSSPDSINLTGTAAPVTVTSPTNTSPIATYTLSQGSLTFPNTGVGNVSPTQTVTLTNTGTTTLHLATLRTTPDFTLSNNCPTAIVPAATCTLIVTFTPTATGIRTGSAQVASDSGISLDFVTLFGLSFPSSLALTPQSLDFGSILVGASATQPAQLTNNGQVPVTLSSITATGDYTPTSNCPASLAVNANCTVQVAFTPTTAGTRSGTLSVTNSATTLPLVTSLTGVGLQSHLQLSPTSLAFGNVGIGSGLNLSLLLTNNGTAPISGIALSITGDYTIASPCAVATLAPSQTCTVAITFTPAITGVRSGTLTITSSDATSPATVPLNGTGIQSHLQINPIALVFGSVALNASSTQSLTLTNTGTASITSLAPAISGDYAIATPCGTPILTPGQTCTIAITFTPTGSGARTGALTLTSSDPASPSAVPLTGTGTQSHLQATPATLNFGSIALGSSITQSLTLTNTGTATLTPIAATISGDYSIASPCSATSLAPSQSCSITIAFRPTATGSRVGTLNIASSDPASPTAIPLTGTGTQSHLQITPAAITFGSVTIGSSSTQTLTLANTGTATLSSLSIIVTGDYTVTTPCASTTLSPAQSCSVGITFTPTLTGARAGTLTVTSSDSTSPAAIPITGTGTTIIVPANPGNFTLTVNGGPTATATVASGSTATYNLTITPINGFTGPVVFNCTPLTTAAYSSCAMLPSTITLAGAPQYATLTITTLTALNGAHATSTPLIPLGRTLLCFVAPGCFLFLRRKRRRALPILFVWTFLSALALSATGCGGTPNPNLLYVTPGTYQYQVTASSTATVPITQSVNVTVVVTN